MMPAWLAVFVGGGAGSLLRYGLGLFLRRGDGLFPCGTFAANVLGCFLIGLFYALSSRLSLSAEVRLLLTTGLCGGFTTFSTFSYESLQLFQQEHYLLFFTYILGSLLLGRLAAWLGLRLL